MPRSTRRMWLEAYRSYRLDVRENGRTGWAVAIYPPPGEGSIEVLRTEAPAALGSLVDQARHQVDQRLMALAAQ